MKRRQRRPGITLVEVLVAIFVMAIGLLSLLVLFPLGVLRMSQAIQDDHTMHLADNAEAITIFQNIPGDANVEPLLKNPGGTLPDASEYGPSYPVFVDPVGKRASAQDWIGGLEGSIARTVPAFVLSSGSISTPALRRWFYLLDDITNYNEDGVVSGPERDLRYSWACMVQRPSLNYPAIANVSIVVYASRPVTLNLNNQSIGEFAHDNVTFDLQSNTVFVPSASGVPEVRVGSWILDATTVNGQGHLIQSNHPHAHGNFYRVVAVTPSASGVTLELEQSIRGFATNGTGRIFTLDGVAEVFERRITLD